MKNITFLKISFRFYILEMVDKFYKCSKILVNNDNFDLILPQAGECMLNVHENYGTITLKIMKIKNYYNSKLEEELITHSVCNLN